MLSRSARGFGTAEILRRPAAATAAMDVAARIAGVSRARVLAALASRAAGPRLVFGHPAQDGGEGVRPGYLHCDQGLSALEQPRPDSATGPWSRSVATVSAGRGNYRSQVAPRAHSAARLLSEPGAAEGASLARAGDYSSVAARQRGTSELSAHSKSIRRHGNARA